MERYQGEVVAAQETKVLDSQVAEVQSKLLSMGWKATFAPAIWTGEKGQEGLDQRHVSAGVMVACRSHMDAWPRTTEALQRFKGRLVAMNLRRKPLGWMIFYSAYFLTCEGLDYGLNEELLDTIRADIQSHGRPYIVAADFQWHHEMLEQTDFHRFLKGVVMACGEGTCRTAFGGATELDYFYVTPR